MRSFGGDFITQREGIVLSVMAVGHVSEERQGGRSMGQES